MIGPILNAGAIVVGGFAGGCAGHRLPERIRSGLPHVFGLVALALGIALTVKVQHFAPIVLSLVVGTALGEYLSLQDRVHRIAHHTQRWMPRPAGSSAMSDEEIDRIAATFSSLVVVFCASATGMVGALREGLSGDSSLLFAKAILDGFTAIVFAVTVGYNVVLLGIPVLLIEGLLVLVSHPLGAQLSQTVIMDTSACGGIILVGTGLRILDIKPLRVINMLPALVLMPFFSALMALITR
ncbi:MAG: DUF554 domain-containing protein [Holophaga sp.]|nr:DUF554 domain-containing protein [Holophaga sp.]